jgi:hypothetical protein
MIEQLDVGKEGVHINVDNNLTQVSRRFELLQLQIMECIDVTSDITIMPHLLINRMFNLFCRAIRQLVALLKNSKDIRMSTPPNTSSRYFKIRAIFSVNSPSFFFSFYPSRLPPESLMLNMTYRAHSPHKIWSLWRHVQ